MTPAEYMESWMGAKQGDATHKLIIDNYNTIKPLPNGFKMNYTSPWCATTVSTAFWLSGYGTKFPYSASCSDMIKRATKLGIWVEDDAYVPQRGDVIIYDWQDSATNYATTDDKSAPDHTGIVLKCDGKTMYIGEGNYGTKHIVHTRKMSVNGRYIRGFITPNGTNKPATKTSSSHYSRRTLQYGMSGDDVKELHKVLRTFKYGVDADNNKFDMLTKSCIVHFQTVNNLTVDGIVGQKTYKALGML